MEKYNYPNFVRLGDVRFGYLVMLPDGSECNVLHKGNGTRMCLNSDKVMVEHPDDLEVKNLTFDLVNLSPGDVWYFGGGTKMYTFIKKYKHNSILAYHDNQFFRFSTLGAQVILLHKNRQTAAELKKSLPKHRGHGINKRIITCIDNEW